MNAGQIAGNVTSANGYKVYVTSGLDCSGYVGTALRSPWL
jgi:hypothetical protein